MCLFYLAGGSLKLIAGLSSIDWRQAFMFIPPIPIFAAALNGFSTCQPVTLIRSTKPWMPFWSGGVTGVGPGDGKVKSILPDAHADYVFAVAAEEGGLLMGGFIILTAFSYGAR